MSKIKKKRSTTKKDKGGLSSTPPAGSHAVSWKEGIGIGLLTTAVGAGFGGAGAALGPWSIPLGVISAIYGVKRNDKWSKFLIAGGVGLIAGTTIKNIVDGQTNGINDKEEVDGFDFNSMVERAKTYYKNLGQKFMLPKADSDKANTETDTSTNGMNGGEEVTYFVNPYTQNKLDTSELDRITQQVANMNAPVGELEFSDRNF